MKRKNFFPFILSLFLFTACNSQTAGVKNLDATNFEQMITKGDVQLVDVRTPDEYNDKHIANAKNINYNGNDFEKQMSTLDKSKPVYIYCLAGGRSKKAADWAVANGFKEVYNLESGITSWMAEKKPVTNGSGQEVNTSNIGMSFDDYLSHIKQSNKLVIVDFNAVWCGP